MDRIKSRLIGVRNTDFNSMLNLWNEISKFPEIEQNEMWKEMANGEFLLNRLNTALSDSNSRLFEFIANCCKNVSCRQFFTKSVFIERLFDLFDWSDYDLAKQLCRTLGNICYENQTACSMIYKYDGVGKIINLLNSQIFDGRSIEERRALKEIIFGFLLNVSNDRPEYQDIALQHNLIESISEAISTEADGIKHNGLVTNCVLLLFCFIENQAAVQKLKKLDLVCNFIELVKNLQIKKIQTQNLMDQIDLETVESIVDLVAQLSKNDQEIRLKYVEKGIIEILIDVVDHKLIEEEQILRTTSNLIVMLAADEKVALKYYDGGKGLVYVQAKKWLDDYISQLEASKKATDEVIVINNPTPEVSPDSQKDDFLNHKVKNLFKENTQLTTSALVIGNLTSSNEIAIAICNDGLLDKLVRVVELNEDFSIQFTCLSTLRNLAIPEQNKRYFITNGLLTRLLALNHSESPSVVFKYLATLRLVCDQQSDAAFEIINTEKLIEDLKVWVNLESLTGVKSEGSRLLTNLFRSLQKLDFNRDLIMDKRLLGCLFEQTKADHLKMQEEAVYAINVLINKFEFNEQVYELLNEKLMTDFHNLLQFYDKEGLYEIELEFIQEVFCTLSSALLKYNLKLNSEICGIISNLTAKYASLSFDLKAPAK